MKLNQSAEVCPLSTRVEGGVHRGGALDDQPEKDIAFRVQFELQHSEHTGPQVLASLFKCFCQLQVSAIYTYLFPPVYVE